MTLLECLNTYKIEAFRLETLPVYTIPQEKESLDAFLIRGELVVSSDFAEYISVHSNKVLEGKRHIRARVIPNPITDYFRYETNIGYLNQNHAGFELFFIEQADYEKIRKDFPGYNFDDFWLFDKQTLVKMNYNAKGEFLGTVSSSIIDDVNNACKIRDVIIKNGKSFSYLIDNYNILKNS